MKVHFTILSSFLNVQTCCPSSWFQVLVKYKAHPFLQYLNGVERTVFGVWTTCRCGVTPEKSLSCNGVLSPPFNGVSTLVKAMRFWASWLARREKLFSNFRQIIIIFSPTSIIQILKQGTFFTFSHENQERKWILGHGGFLYIHPCSPPTISDRICLKIKLFKRSRGAAVQW